MAEPDREAYEAAERLVREAHGAAEEAARAAADSVRRTAGATARAAAARRVPGCQRPCSRWSSGLRGTLPPELARQLADALRELLIALRAVLDYTIDRLDRPPPGERDVEDIPISMSRLASLPKELQLAALAAIALALSLVLPWYQKSIPQQGQSSRATSRARRRSRSSRPRSCSSPSPSCSSSGRARSAALPPAGRRRRRDHAGRRLGGAAARLAAVRQARRSRAPGATMGVQWGIFGALLAAGALIVAGARVRPRTRPSRRTRPPTSRVGRLPRLARASARGPPPARRRGHRVPARPPGVGGRAGDAAAAVDPPDASREQTTRLPGDPSREQTTRLPTTAPGAHVAALRRPFARARAPGSATSRPRGSRGGPVGGPTRRERRPADRRRCGRTNHPAAYLRPIP